MGRVWRGCPDSCESSTESRDPGACRPVELITREMGIPAEERVRKAVLASVLDPMTLPKQAPRSTVRDGPRLRGAPLPLSRANGGGGGAAAVHGPETPLSIQHGFPRLHHSPCSDSGCHGKVHSSPHPHPTPSGAACHRPALGRAQGTYASQAGNSLSCPSSPHAQLSFPLIFFSIFLEINYSHYPRKELRFCNFLHGFRNFCQTSPCSNSY